MGRLNLILVDIEHIGNLIYNDPHGHLLSGVRQVYHDNTGPLGILFGL